MSNMNIQVNKYQTPITDELLSLYPEEVQEQLLDFITNVEFIKWLISPDRPYAKDCPRDEHGRVIVDLAHPHILEDMDYFRQPAIHFTEHGCYTFLKPNSNPQSEYRKFWEEEKRRCRDGYVRESDGEWVTGFCYWFLNYNPMMVNIREGAGKKAIRKEGFPFTFEGIYWRFHYLWQAREEGSHAIELAKRGAHPYFEKVYTPNGIKSWREIKVGDTLYGTYNNITTVIDIPFDDIADTYKITLQDGRVVYASDDHLWNVIRNGKKLLLNTKYLSEHYFVNRSNQYRIPSGKEYIYGIPKNQGVEFPVTDVSIDSYTLGVLLGGECFKNKYFKNQVAFTSTIEDIDNYTTNIPYPIIQYTSNNQIYIVKCNIQYLYDCGLWMCKSENKFIPNDYKCNSRNIRLSILQGLLDTNGTVHGNVPCFDTISERFRDDVIEIARSLGYNCSYVSKKASYKKGNNHSNCNEVFTVSIYGGSELFRLNRKKNKVNDSKIERRTISTIISNIEYIGKHKCKCVTVDSKDSSYLIGDFVQTHNCAKSYSLASIMTHNLELGENSESWKRVITVLTAYQKEYLSDSKDGTLSKFKPALNFIWANTPFARLTLKNSPNEMAWQMGYKDEYGIERGSLNQVLAVSSKDDTEKIRGKRGWILFEEMGSFKGLLSLYDITRKSVEDGDLTFACMYLVGCVCVGTKVWTHDGRCINIEELNKKDGIVGFTPTEDITVDSSIMHLNRGTTKEPISSNINIANKPCVKITLCNGNTLECSSDHPIFIQKHRMNHDGTIDYYEEVFKYAGNLKVGDRVIECREIPVFGNDTLFDARLVGMLIGDGIYGEECGTRYYSKDAELLKYVKNKCDCIVPTIHTTKKGNSYEELGIRGLVHHLRNIEIYGQTKMNKRLPINYQTLDKENTILLLSGLYDTGGSKCLSKKDGYIYLTQSNREILEQVKILWRKFGVLGDITKTNPKIKKGRKDKNTWYTLTISERYSAYTAAKILKLLVPCKQENLNKIIEYYNTNPSKKEQKYPKDIVISKVKNVEEIGEKPVYNLTAGLSHTYLANNIVTHNTAAESESDFSSAKTLLYSPRGYNIKAIKNVWDKPKQGKPEFGFFFPAYVNRADCYNGDGVSDVVKALLQILMARYKAKYSADPKSVLRIIAEDPITPAEAIIKVKAAYFPTAQINERIFQLDSDPNVYNDVYVGQLVLNKEGKVEFKISVDEPIRKWGVANTTTGAIEIFSMPEKDSNGNIYSGRYIIGHDPVDNDQAESSSLSSTFVFDLFTDKIVAEFTGRKAFADDNFEIVRMFCIFYNAKCLFESNKKGIYAYFAKMNCTHYLSETPEYLREKQLVKYTSFGSNKYGVNASAAINDYANGLIRDWLLKPQPTITVNDSGEETETTIPTLYSIRNRALLDELTNFSPEINVDRIRALGMVMLAREEKIILYQGDMSKAKQTEMGDELARDEFFTKNYDQRFLSKFSKNA